MLASVMHWIAPCEKDTDNVALEKRLRDSVDRAVPAPHFPETNFISTRPEGLLGREDEIKHGGNINSYDDDSHSRERGGQKTER